MTGDIEIAFYQQFMVSLANLPNAIQKKTNAFLKKFAANPTSSGINFERLNGTNPDYRSVRIDKAYRAILLMPKTGNQYVMLWVDRHDDAYDWAARTEVRVHPRTHVLQVFRTLPTEVVNVEACARPGHDLPSTEFADSASSGSASSGSEERTEEASLPSEPLFNLDASRLLGIGVPESRVPLIENLRSRTELDGTRAFLPEEAYEALALFADGMDWLEVWEVYGPSAEAVDTDDIAAALSQPGSQRQFRVVESESELERMLTEPLERWRVYLHPSQRQLIERDRRGPVRVTGGAGTGKTVVAMHRAVHLARRVEQGERRPVLFLTYNTNLAKDIAAHLDGLAPPDVIGRIEVVNVDAWLWRALSRVRYPSKLCTDQNAERLLDAALALTDVQQTARSESGNALPRSFFGEEWSRVVLPQRVTSLEHYLQADRTGRGVGLTRRQRASLWPVFGELRSVLTDGDWVVRHDAMLDARDMLDAGTLEAGCKHVIVDETQDMGGEALRLIRAMVPEGPDDLFFVGDGRQRIFARAAVMKHCGIHIVGRSHKLRINYRTTEEIRRFASALMQDCAVDDLDGGEDDGRESLSLTSGPTPFLLATDDERDEIDRVAERLDVLRADEVPLSNCCVMLRTTRLRDRFADGLRDRGMATVTLGKDADDPTAPGVRVANMHRVKGLEFQHVFMAGMNAGTVPNEAALRSTEDKTERREIERAERSLVHVCATRAVASLTVSWNGVPSRFLSPDG